MYHKAATSADRTVATIYRNLDSSGNPLVLGEIIEASPATVARLGLTNGFGTHFRKTYFPGAHGDPKQEFRITERIWQQGMGDAMPKPLGFTKNTIRTELIEGTAWAALSPIQRGRNMVTGKECKPAACSREFLAQYWDALDVTFKLFQRLHTVAVHGDGHRNNVLFVQQKGHLVPKFIDFEDCVELKDIPQGERAEAKQDDLTDLMAEARILQQFFGDHQSKLGLLSRAPEI